MSSVPHPRPVVETRPAVEQNERRFLAHRRPVRHEPGTLDIEIEPDPIDADVHLASLPAIAPAYSNRRLGEAKRATLLITDP